MDAMSEPVEQRTGEPLTAHNLDPVLEGQVLLNDLLQRRPVDARCTQAGAL